LSSYETSSNETPRSRDKRRFRPGPALIPLALFLVIAAVFAMSLLSGDPSKLPSALIGKPAPTVRMEPLVGLTRGDAPVPSFGKADLTNGRAAVVNFWASWCVPCRQEHPLLEKLSNDTGVAIYGVNYKDPNGGGLKFLRQLGNPYAAVGTDPVGSAAIEWGVYGMPETFIVDGAGRVVFKHVGPITPQSLRSEIIPALAKARSGGA